MLIYNTVQDSTSTTQIFQLTNATSEPVMVLDSEVDGSQSAAIIPSSVSAALVLILVLVLIIVTVTILCVKRSTAKVVLQVSGDGIELGDRPKGSNNMKSGSALPEIRYIEYIIM